MESVRRQTKVDHPTMSFETFPYTCDVKITLPNERQADIAKKVMEVDEEIGNRARKTLQIDSQHPTCLLV